MPERSDEDIGPNDLALMVPEARDLPTEAICRMREAPGARGPRDPTGMPILGRPASREAVPPVGALGVHP